MNTSSLTPYRMIRSIIHPLVRDLAWSILSATIIRTPISFSPKQDDTNPQIPNPTDHLPSLYAWLKEVDHNPQTLIDHLSQGKDHRLGIYFEQLICFWLKAQGEIFHQNLAIHDEHRTIGAFDVIIVRNTHSLHLEFTVKYYLEVSQSNQEPRWVGLQKRDNFQKKLLRLQEHQLKLGTHPASRQLFTSLNLKKIVRSEAWVKGILFAQWNENLTMNPSAYRVRGLWIRSHQFQSFNHWLINHIHQLTQMIYTPLFYIRFKPQWLAPLTVSIDPEEPLEVTLKRDPLALNPSEVQQLPDTLINGYWGDRELKKGLMTSELVLASLEDIMLEKKRPIHLSVLFRFSPNRYDESLRLVITPDDW